MDSHSMMKPHGTWSRAHALTPTRSLSSTILGDTDTSDDDTIIQGTQGRPAQLNGWARFLALLLKISSQQICKLCNTTPETPKHLCKDCPFTCAVWVELVNWLNLHQLPTSGSVSSIYRWWKKCQAMIVKESKSVFDGLIIYFWWNIWKERNRRTFRQKQKTVTEITYLIKEDVQQFQQAVGVVNGFIPTS